MIWWVGTWATCALVILWALFVAGRLKSPVTSAFALLLGVAPFGVMLLGQLRMPQLELLDVAGLAAGSVGLLSVWMGAVSWAREAVPSPKVDAARMVWTPRPSHRPTWVIAAGLSTVLTLALVATGSPVVAVVLWFALFVAHWWAHQGERGPLRVEARDVVLAGERVAIEALATILREVRYLGPVRREHLVLQHREGRRLHWLVTGSPAEDVVAVQHLLLQQRDFARDHGAEREPTQPPPEWLRDIHQHGGPPVAVEPKGNAT